MKKVVIEKREKRVLPRGGKLAKRLPPLESVFENDGDPLESVEYRENDLEHNSDVEMSEVVKQIKEAKRAQFDRFRVSRDPDYWLALCFQSREQRDEFLRRVGWTTIGGRYVNGLDVARRLGADIEPIDLSPLPARGKPKKYKREEVI